MIARLVMAAALVVMATSAFAQDVTVASLLKDGFAIAGTMMTPAGAGLFMRKDEKLYFCVAAETPTSKEVTTRYCKPVR